MKKLFTVFVIIALTISVFAQTPQKTSYQAVIRNSNDQLLTNHAIGMRISIIQGSSTGTVVYVETHTATTNSNGLITIEIGGGIPVIGTFEEINWSGTYFMKIETDPSGGTNYTITGISPILPVPYALFARTAGNVSWQSNGSNIYCNYVKVGIGTSTPEGYLQIYGNSSTDFPQLLLSEGEGDYARLSFNNSTEKKNWSIAGRPDATDINSRLNFWYWNGTSGADIMSITGGGYVGIGTVTPNYKLDVRGTIGNNTTLYHSDLRWKTDIKQIKYGIDELLKLNSICYLWNADDYPEMGFDNETQFGFIAQEFEKVIPELVKTDKDGFKSIDYVKLTPVLVEAIKVQQQQIESTNTGLMTCRKIIRVGFKN